MDSKDQLVSLKVMRLLKPSIYSCMPVYTETEHFTENIGKLILDQAFQSCNSILSKDSSTTDALVIPQIFGNLYIGETFTSYICLYNQSMFKVKELSIRVELQTNTQKIHLPFKSNIDTVDEFEPDQKFDGVVEYDVKELGNHILICLVSYVNDKSERMSFKKFYKFMVSKPFEIQPKYPTIETKNDSLANSILFEAQIQNITNGILFMEQVKLYPLREDIKINELTPSNAANKDAKHLKNLNLLSIMKPGEVKQYLYRVDYKNIDEEKKPLTVGKLDISWRYAFGECGHLQTHPLEQPKEIYDLNNRDIEVSFGTLPDKCVVDEAIIFDCLIKNRSERELDVMMKLSNDKKNGFLWNCNLSYDIGKLAPKASHVVKLNIVPFQTGLLSLAGIQIVDLFLNRVHEFSKALNIFIQDI